MWADAAPNFLIGLREGLEAGLVVSILVATVVRAGRHDQLPAVWAGVAAAVALSLAAGAVLTFGAADLPTSTQEAIGGVLSLVAVAFVTMMVFWMRRSARDLAGHLRTRTEAALTLGARLLVLTAFLAVAREGLETALFLWSTTRTAGETLGPRLGAVAGLAVAVGLCWALYRRALHLNLTRFFTWTGAALIVVAAGVLAYGIRDLQGAGILPGAERLAFDVTGVIDPTAGYARLVEGVLNITPTMTVLAVTAYVAYLVPVLRVVLWSARSTAVSAVMPEPALASELAPAVASELEPEPTGELEPAVARGRAMRSPFVMASAGIAVASVLVAGVAIVRLGPKPAAAATIVVGDGTCAAGWSPPSSGRHDFAIHNTGSRPTEVYLLADDRTRAFGEIEGLAPGTTRTLSVTIGPGRYVWRCLPLGGTETYSESGLVQGEAVAAAESYVPVTPAELDGAVTTYRAAVSRLLVPLQADVAALRVTVAAGDLRAARTAWLATHLDYERLGAAYGTFGDLDRAINGRSDGLPGGAADPDFTGFGRLEAELWAPGLTAPGPQTPAAADGLVADVTTLVARFPTLTTDPNDLPLRAHEILENSIQFELTGITDHGSHTNLATLAANIDGTGTVLDAIAPALASRDAATLADARADLAALAMLVGSYRRADGTWTPLDHLTRAERQRLNGLTGHLVEVLAPVPDLLELPPSPPS